MPQSSLAMASLDSDGEVPDRSLGSISLNATGEQLDDIQVNLDQMYLDSPGPGSSLSGSDGAGGTSTMSVNSLSLKATLSRAAWECDQEGFDRLALIELSEVSDQIDNTDWLMEPPAEVPPAVDEDDRSFLDTNLLNKRFHLLNYVIGVINEERMTELRQNILAVQAEYEAKFPANKGATIKLNRTFGKAHAGRNIPGAILSQNGGNGDGEESQVVFGSVPATVYNNEDSDVLLSAISSPTLTSGSGSGGLSTSKSKSDMSVSSEAETTGEDGAIRTPRRASQPGIITSASPKSSFPLDFGNTAFIDDKTVANSSTSSIGFGADSHGNSYHGDVSSVSSRNSAASDCTLLGRRSNVSGNTSGLTARSSTGYFGDESTCEEDDRGDFIPQTFSPVVRASIGSGIGTYKIKPKNSLNGRRISLGDSDNSQAENDPMNAAYVEDSSGLSGSFSREIDTRTYTRPKKSRMTIASPHRQLNVTMERSPQRHANSLAESSPHQLLNRTIELSPQRRSSALSNASPHRQLNTTIDLSPDCQQYGVIGSPVNLNETFVADSDDAYPSAVTRARRVTRNLSYVIRREEQSPNNNSSPHHVASPAKVDLNNTFTYDPDADIDIDSPVTKGSQNTSMEDLNSRVASQIRSLGCSTSIPRRRASDQVGVKATAIPHFEEARSVVRTSSTDTYSVAHSSESPASSECGTPMDSNALLEFSDPKRFDGGAWGKSMPNLHQYGPSLHLMPQHLHKDMNTSLKMKRNQYVSDRELAVDEKAEGQPPLTVYKIASDSPVKQRYKDSTYTQDDWQSLTAQARAEAAGLNVSTPSLCSPRLLDRGTRVYSSGVIDANKSNPIYGRTSSGLSLYPTYRLPPKKQFKDGAEYPPRSNVAPRYNYPVNVSNRSPYAPPQSKPTANPPVRAPSGVRASSVSAKPMRATNPALTQPSRFSSNPRAAAPSRIPNPAQMSFRFGYRPPRPNVAPTRPIAPRASASQKGPPADDWRDGCY